jgi:hypothetical protein
VSLAACLARLPAKSARNIGAPLITESASMSYIDMLYFGLVLVAFLGFGGTLLYCSERWSNRQPPPDWKARVLRIRKIP